MEKLVKLLNEYCKEKKIGEWSMLENGYLFLGNKPIKNKKEEFDLLIISKHYGFIERLVKENKIDLEEVEKINQTGNVYIRFGGDYEKVLMLLSIQDNPIEYLCSILKE